MQRGRQLKKPVHVMAEPPKPVIKPVFTYKKGEVDSALQPYSTTSVLVTPPSNDEAVHGGWIPWWSNWYGPMGFPWFVRGDGPTAPVAGTPAECHR
ncbi:hypothetical protein OSTOST_09614 [Ostertagia ostertagi]